MGLKHGNANRARNVYQRAIDVGGSEATHLMKQGFADAKTTDEADRKATELKMNSDTKDMLQKN